MSNLFGAPNFEAYIKKISKKQPKNRSKIEREILDFYRRAEQEGEQFCYQKAKEKFLEKVRNNYIIVLIFGAFVTYVFIRGLTR